MELLYFILLWLYMGEVSRVKLDADNDWALILLYIFSPMMHVSIFFIFGAKVYFKKSWLNI